MGRKKNLTVRIDNIETLQDLMQEVYHDACGQIVDAQKTINTLTSASEPQDTDDHTKIAKAKVDALKIKDSAIKIKLDVGRLQNDIIKSQGALTGTLSEIKRDNGDTSLQTFEKLREMVKEGKAKNGE